MRYKPERALTRILITVKNTFEHIVEMRYKPERALTHFLVPLGNRDFFDVEMRYKPERALTPKNFQSIFVLRLENIGARPLVLTNIIEM